MTQASKQPQFSEEKQCKHCGNKAPMKRAAQYARTVTHFEEETGQTWDESDCYELLECPACGKVELRSYGWSNLMEPSDVVYQTLYPVSSRIPLGLPKPIQKEYEAALQVKSISPNAYGVLMGRVLEMVCEDRKAAGDNLYQKLADLAAKAEIPNKLVAVADKLRVFRNLGAHAVLGELTENEVPILESLSRAILEYVYSAPFLADQAKSALDKLKRRRRAPPKN